jgi:hypothetical protein
MATKSSKSSRKKQPKTTKNLVDPEPSAQLTSSAMSEMQLRSITNALPVLIADVDNRECYQFNNQAYVDWLGKSLTAIHGALYQGIGVRGSFGSVVLM